MRKSVKMIAGSIALSTILLLAACGSDEGESDAALSDYPQFTEEVAEDEQEVVMKTSKGEIRLKLFPEYTPKTVENFVTHAEEGYYEGVTFHRVLQDFMIQGGDPTGTGAGGESIYGEAFEDEFDPNLVHIRGALSMANSGPNTNSSQFFIVQNDEIDDHMIESLEQAIEGGNIEEKVFEEYRERGGTPHLDTGHTVFGQVIDGMEVVDEIAAVPVDGEGRPDEDVVIEEVEVIK